MPKPTIPVNVRVPAELWQALASDRTAGVTITSVIAALIRHWLALTPTQRAELLENATDTA